MAEPTRDLSAAAVSIVEMDDERIVLFAARDPNIFREVARWALRAQPRGPGCGATECVNECGGDFTHATCPHVRALKRLTIAARTSGGTAGPDTELMAACAETEALLAAAPPPPDGEVEQQYSSKSSAFQLAFGGKPPLDEPERAAGAWKPTHRHVKRGTSYQVVGMAAVQSAEQIGEGDTVVVYRAENGMLWVRPRAEFFDGRFTPVAAAPTDTGRGE